MLHPLGYDYIKYLNDEDSHGLTYDQWKYKKTGKNSDQCNRCGKNISEFNICPKCKY